MAAEVVFESLLLPAGVTVAVAAGCGLATGGRLPAAVGAVALAAGYVAGDVAGRGFVGWWPADTTRRLPWVLALAAAVAVWEGVIAGPGWRRALVHGGRLAAATATAYLLAKSARNGHGPAAVWVAVLAGLAGYFWLHWGLLDRAARREPPRSLWALPVCSLAAAGMMALTGWSGLAQAFAALGACLAVAVVVDRLRPGAKLTAGTTGGFVLGYGSLVWCAYWFGDLPVPAAVLLLVPAALTCVPVPGAARLVPAAALAAVAAAAGLVLLEAPGRGEPPTGTVRDYCFVSVHGASRIAVFASDPVTGALRPCGGANTPGKPLALAVDEDHCRLFSSLYDPDRLASFRIDPETGGLTPVSVVPAGGKTVFLATDRAGRFLLAAGHDTGRVTVHAVGPDGAIGADPLAIVATAAETHAVVPTPDDRFALVAHTSGGIHALRFDAAAGTLAPDPAPWTAPPNDGPRHLVFHPTRDVVYAVNEGSQSVTAFRFDRGAGTLTPCQTASTLPVGYAGQNTPAEVRVHPSGRFLFASNRGHDSIARFRTDPTGEHLTPLGPTATERRPWSFDLAPGGQFLYAAGEEWGRLSAYRLNEETGSLTRVGIYEVGPNLRWVRTARLPAAPN